MTDKQSQTHDNGLYVAREKYRSLGKVAEKSYQNYTSTEKSAIQCNIPTMRYRRIKEDMIETYKIVPGKYQRCVAPTLYKGIGLTRGNDLRLKKFHVKYDLYESLVFTRVTLAIAGISCCPSVRLSQVGVLLKRLKIELRKQAAR